MQLAFDSKIQKLIFSVLFLAFIPFLAAQKSGEQQNPPPTVTVRTSLVMVPAIITDKHGAVIEDLAKGDFIVKEDGKPQTIAIFEHIRHRNQPEARAGVPAGIYSKRLKEYQPARLAIIGLDAIR